MSDITIGQMGEQSPRNPEEPMRLTLMNPTAEDHADLVKRVREMNEAQIFSWIEIPKQADGAKGALKVPYGDGRGIMELRMTFDLHIVGAWRA